MGSADLNAVFYGAKKEDKGSTSAMAVEGADGADAGEGTSGEGNAAGNGAGKNTRKHIIQVTVLILHACVLSYSRMRWVIICLVDRLFGLFAFVSLLFAFRTRD